MKKIALVTDSRYNITKGRKYDVARVSLNGYLSSDNTKLSRWVPMELFDDIPDDDHFTVRRGIEHLEDFKCLDECAEDFFATHYDMVVDVFKDLLKESNQDAVGKLKEHCFYGGKLDWKDWIDKKYWEDE